MLPSFDKLARLPEAVIRPGASAAGRAPRLLTPVYGKLRQSFSGTSWYLAQAAMAEAVLEGAFTLNSQEQLNAQIKVAGALWKAQRFLRGKRIGGFKFAELFNEVLWSQHIDDLAGTVLINNFQIYGRPFMASFERLGIRPCYYIDGTLTEYFYCYGRVEDQTIGTDIVKRAIEVEREGYASAARIVAMSMTTKTTLVEAYSVPAHRVTVILPGANLDDSAVPSPSPHEGWLTREFTLGFVGLFPLRKGLDKLAEAVRILRGRAVPVRLCVVGRCPESIAAQEGVEFLGAIDKAHDTERFVAALRRVDLGCQISRVELLGIAMLEFLRLGIPVMATATSGMPDVLHDGGGILVPTDITAEQLADEVQSLIRDLDRYDALRKQACRRAAWASWRRSAKELDQTLSNLH